LNRCGGTADSGELPPCVAPERGAARRVTPHRRHARGSWSSAWRSCGETRRTITRSVATHMLAGARTRSSCALTSASPVVS